MRRRQQADDAMNWELAVCTHGDEFDNITLFWLTGLKVNPVCFRDNFPSCRPIQRHISETVRDKAYVKSNR